MYFYEVKKSLELDYASCENKTILHTTQLPYIIKTKW